VTLDPKSIQVGCKLQREVHATRLARQKAEVAVPRDSAEMHAGLDFDRLV
jgi:hypothetical protein